MLKVLFLILISASAVAADLTDAHNTHLRTAKSIVDSERFDHENTWQWVSGEIQQAATNGAYTVEVHYALAKYPEIQKRLESLGYKFVAEDNYYAHVSW
jgi:hypothetical protein